MAKFNRIAAYLGAMVLGLAGVALVSGPMQGQSVGPDGVGSLPSAPLAVEPLAVEPLAVEPMPFEQAGQSFPGSAYYYVIDDSDLPQASPWYGQKTQFDHASPPAPPLAMLQAPDGAAAAPLPRAHPLAGLGKGLDFERALTCLTQAIYYEAASEADAGQRAVAQVVLNRLAHPAFPKTVCDVVYQGSERPTGCQFTFTCDGALARKPVAWFWRRAELVAQAALRGATYAPVGLATHYHTFAVHPLWADSLHFLDQIGAHRFYALKGPVGSAQHFRFIHARPEPLPGPHAALALASAYGDGLTIGPAQPNPTLPNPTLPNRHLPLETAARATETVPKMPNLPANQSIRPEYRNSGQWIAQPH